MPCLWLVKPTQGQTTMMLDSVHGNFQLCSVISWCHGGRAKISVRFIQLKPSTMNRHTQIVLKILRCHQLFMPALCATNKAKFSLLKSTATFFFFMISWTQPFCRSFIQASQPPATLTSHQPFSTKKRKAYRSLWRSKALQGALGKEHRASEDGTCAANFCRIFRV